MIITPPLLGFIHIIPVVNRIPDSTTDSYCIEERPMVVTQKGHGRGRKYIGVMTS